MTPDILLKLQTLLRNFALQVVMRALTQAALWLTSRLVQYQLVDDGIAAQVVALVPFVVASILIETGFSYLQKVWNKLQINKAKTLPADATNHEVRAGVVADIKEARAAAQTEDKNNQ